MTVRFVADVSSSQSLDLDGNLALIDKAGETGCSAVKFQLFASREHPARGSLAQGKADPIVWGTKLDLESIDHAVNVAGIDHVGLSSHHQSVPQWKEFTGSLVEHGYSEEDAGKVLGENTLRVLRDTIR